MKWAAIVLVALVVSYILYLCNLFVIAFGGKRSNPSSAEGEIDDKLKSLLTTCNMDCEFLMIWESQLPVLEELHRSGKRGYPGRRCANYFVISQTITRNRRKDPARTIGYKSYSSPRSSLTMRRNSGLLTKVSLSSIFWNIKKSIPARREWQLILTIPDCS